MALDKCECTLEEYGRDEAHSRGNQRTGPKPMTRLASAGPSIPGNASDERGLVAAARAGDRDALARLYERHAPMVSSVLLARVARADAEDLVQEVFLRAMSHLDSLQSPGAIGPWLASIARNLAADSGRARARAPHLRLTGAPEPVAPEASEPAMDVDEVLAAIRALPEAYRDTIALRLIERFTGPQIAEQLGLTHGSVRVNLCRGMKLLRESLAAHLGMDGAS
jgi:RNA polymerase sigma-70 factor, ECF subfamily